jgi:hypothetical protein
MLLCRIKQKFGKGKWLKILLITYHPFKMFIYMNYFILLRKSRLFNVLFVYLMYWILG